MARGLILLLVMAFTFTACTPALNSAESASTAPTPGTAGRPGTDAPDDRPLVITTFTVLADIAQNIAGDHLRVESLTKPGAEIHGYEPTPGDLTRVSGADLVIDNGLELEAWFDRFMRDITAPHVVASDGVTPIEIASERVDTAGQPPVNPHAWMSPVAAQTYVDNIVRAFSDLDPGNAADYHENGARYQQELQRLHDELIGSMRSVPRAQRTLVSCEGAFSYLTRDVGLDEKYLWAVNAERQATPKRVAGVIEAVREQRIPAVFCESTVSNGPMLRVVESTDAVFGGTLYVDSLSEPDGPVPTYLELVRHNIALIQQGLSKGTA